MPRADGEHERQGRSPIAFASSRSCAVRAAEYRAGAGRPISEADLMRGLLVLGDRAEADARTQVNAVRDARFDSD